MKPMPSSSSVTPKVKRCAPLFTSMPTRPRIRPTITMPIAFSTERLAITTAPIRPSTISEKYSAGPNCVAMAASGAASSAQIRVATVPAMNEPIAAIASAGPGTALPRHLVTVDAGHHRRCFARQVDKDRRGRAAILRTVVDAGQHDQRGRRRQRVGDRQQHGDGRHRPYARQHPDQRAEQDADEAVEQVLHGSPRWRDRARDCPQRQQIPCGHGASSSGRDEPGPDRHGLVEAPYEQRVRDAARAPAR